MKIKIQIGAKDSQDEKVIKLWFRNRLKIKLDEMFKIYSFKIVIKKNEK